MLQMTQQLLDRRIEAVLETVQKPSRYIGGEANQVLKPHGDHVWSRSATRTRTRSGSPTRRSRSSTRRSTRATAFAAERVYCPWPDMADAMRREGMPLFTLETWRPVREVDLLGHHAAGRADVLERARGARPGRASRCARPIAARATRSWWPAAPAPPTPRRWRRSSTRSSWASRRRRSRSCWTPSTPAAGRAARLAAARRAALPLRARRAAAARSSARSTPSSASRRSRREVVVPYSSAIFSRASVEVMRGCTRGCRFCHAGTWYRPVRERPADEVIEAGLEQLSLHRLRRALADVARDERLHRRRSPRSRAIKAERPDLHLSLPSNRVDTGPVAHDRGSERAPGVDHARARGGDAADARHHLQDDHRRDDRERDRGRLQGRLHEPQDVLHDRPARARRTPRCRASSTSASGRARSAGEMLGTRRALHGARQRLELRAEAAHAVPVGGHVEPRPARGEAERTCAGRCRPARSGCPCTTCAPRCSRARWHAATADRRRDRARMAGRRAVRRLDGDVRRSGPGTTAFADAGTTIDDVEATREFGEWDELPWDHVQLGRVQGVPAGRVVAEPGRGGHGRLPLGRLRRLRRLLRPRPQQVGADPGCDCPRHIA